MTPKQELALTMAMNVPRGRWASWLHIAMAIETKLGLPHSPARARGIASALLPTPGTYWHRIRDHKGRMNIAGVGDDSRYPDAVRERLRRDNLLTKEGCPVVDGRADFAFEMTVAELLALV
jgi:alkylated DNA nucleotide flippase Atl1